MIHAISQLEASKAAGILARAAMSLYDASNPAASERIPGESQIRSKLLAEVRETLGIRPDDESTATSERIQDVLDEELDAISSPKNSTEIIEKLAQKGEIPADLYSISIIDQVKDLYSKDWLNEERRIIDTIRSADTEQHFGPETDKGEPSLVSLFAKGFQHKFPYRSFTLLVAAHREGTQLYVHQAWHIFADRVNIGTAKDLIDLLRRFAEEFGVDIRVGNSRGKFVLNESIATKPGAAHEIEIPPTFGTDKNGRRIELEQRTLVSNFLRNESSGKTYAALTVAIDLKRYLAALEAHK